MIRSRTNKLAEESIRGGHPLYDLTKDPQETINYYGDAAYAHVQRPLEDELEQAFQAYALAPFDRSRLHPAGAGQMEKIRKSGAGVFYPEIAYYKDRPAKMY